VLVCEVKIETLWRRERESWDISRSYGSDGREGDGSLINPIAFVDYQAAMLRQISDSSPLSRLPLWSNVPKCDIKGSNSCETVDEATVGLIVWRPVASLSLERASEVENSTVDIRHPIGMSARIHAFQCEAQQFE